MTSSKGPAMSEIRKKEVDAGHYIDTPVLTGENTLEIAESTAFNEVYVISGESALPFCNVVVNAGSTAHITVLVLPGASHDVNLDIDIIGEGADVTISGLYLCNGEEKLRIRTDVRHRKPHCSSYQIFNGIAAGKSDVKFYGKIIVAPDAQKTEAYQTNHNLVLSEGAHAESKPQLEIYADDVKCSHGATVGQLNEDEQFYMRSRGIPEEEAKVLQMISFIAPVLDNITAESLRSSMRETVESAIRSL